MFGLTFFIQDIDKQQAATKYEIQTFTDISSTNSMKNR